MYGHSLDVPHLNDTHLKQQSGAFGTMKSNRSSFSPFGVEQQIEGSLEDRKILAIPPDYLALLTRSMLSKECPQISLLLSLLTIAKLHVVQGLLFGLQPNW